MTDLKEKRDMLIDEIKTQCDSVKILLGKYESVVNPDWGDLADLTHIAEMMLEVIEFASNTE